MVTLRPYEEADIPELFAAVRGSLHELKPWMPWATAEYSIEEAALWVKTTREGREKGTLFEFAVFDENGAYCGACGINRIEAVNGVANLGYWVRSSATGRGIAPAAVRLAAAWAFEYTPLNRLEIVIATGNERSVRVAEKVGAGRDAVLPKRVIVDGRPTSAILYSILRPD